MRGCLSSPSIGCLCKRTRPVEFRIASNAGTTCIDFEVDALVVSRILYGPSLCREPNRENANLDVLLVVGAVAAGWLLDVERCRRPIGSPFASCQDVT